MKQWSLIRVLILLCGVTYGLPARAQNGQHADALREEVARLYRAGKLAAAIPKAEHLLRLHEKALGVDHPLVGQSLNNLAELYREHGRYAEAEPLYKRGLAVWEKARGPAHPLVALSLNNLALLLEEQGRYDEAEPLHKRSLAIRENALDRDDLDVAQSLNNLAWLYMKQRRYGEAEQFYKRSLVLREKTPGPEHALVGQSLNNLALLYQTQGRYNEAESLYARSLALREKLLGSHHPDIAASLNNLAELYREQGRYAEAEPLYKRSLAIWESALGPDHPHVSTALSNLALLALAQYEIASAATLWRRAITLLQRRAERGLDSAQTTSTREEARRSRSYSEWLIKTTYRLAVDGRGNERALAMEMFEMAQWGVTSSAAASLAQMASRSAAGSALLGMAVRERQDLIDEWKAKDRQLIATKSLSPNERDPEAEKKLGYQMWAIDKRRSNIDAMLINNFPDHVSLARPKPASIAEIQAVLNEEEALVFFLDTGDFKLLLPEETFIWVVTKHEMRWRRSNLGTAALAREVTALRCGLDEAAWWPPNSSCLKVAGATFTKADQATGKPIPFDAARAHALYKSLFGEAEDLIQGKHLLLVPSGALTTLPFQILVTKPPSAAGLDSVAWLIRNHAISVLPSVASATALRRTVKSSAATKPMIGFGNPLVDGDQEHPQFAAAYKRLAREARARTGCAATSSKRASPSSYQRRSASPVPQTAGLADLAHLRLQSPLPETADELCAVAHRVGADVRDIRIGEQATEIEVKRLSASGALANYRMIHFATHGLLAGQLSDTREPGLILTPPATPSTDDDGYLSGSEIAALKLDADWVILSACNTAGGAGQGEAADALSGLARMFFYAGARALLVSHWEVDSEATVKLITSAVDELTKDRAVGRGEALRRAMIALMTNTSRPAHLVPASHPSIWAPFVVVGEGGAGR